MSLREHDARCAHDQSRHICADCLRPLSPARTVNEALLDIAVRSLSCVTKDHGLACRCTACSALAIASRAMVEERHKP